MMATTRDMGSDGAQKKSAARRSRPRAFLIGDVGAARKSPPTTRRPRPARRAKTPGVRYKPSLGGRDMADDATRIERDSMGEMRVPRDALWGASTQRAVENFPISGWRFPRGFIRALGLVKS